MVAPLKTPPDAEDKLRDIRAVSDAALSYLGPEDFLTELLSRVKVSMDADTAAVLLLDRSARQLVATAASGLEEEVRQGVRIPVGQGFAGRIAAEARPVILDHVGTPLGIARYEGKRDERFATWREHIRKLADLPNVYVKLGGLAMPFCNFSSPTD